VTPWKARSNAGKLRRGRPRDLDALDALERDTFASDIFAGHLISRASFRRLLEAPSATFIVTEAEPIGAQREAQLRAYVLVLYRANSHAARIYSIAVAARFRRRGLARMLVAAAEQDAVRRGRKAMRLEVRADDRGTIALYESCGYRRVGRAPGYYDGRVDALRLEKALGKQPRQCS
jgi:ribosomal protein S18 acetylase RimI-like enzyme